MSPCRHDFHSTPPEFQITLYKNERALRGRYRCKSTRIAPNSTSPTDLLIGLCLLSLFLAVLIWNDHTFQKGHSVLRCTFRFYFTLILQSIMGTLKAHSQNPEPPDELLQIFVSSFKKFLPVHQVPPSTRGMQQLHATRACMHPSQKKTLLDMQGVACMLRSPGLPP